MATYNQTLDLFSSACFSQLAQPLSTIDGLNYGVGSTLVRLLLSCPLFCVAASLLFQALAYALSAAVSAFFFVKWKFVDADSRALVWRRFGLFTALMCAGSCAGMVSAVATMQQRHYFARINHNSSCSESTLQGLPIGCLATAADNIGQSCYWESVAITPLAVEFLFLCFAKLLVRLCFTKSILAHAFTLPPLQILERMVDFVMFGQDSNQRIAAASKIVVLLTSLLNLVNLCCQAAAANHFVRAYSSMIPVVSSLRSSSFDPIECYLNIDCLALKQFQQAIDLGNLGEKIESYGVYCELISLLVIIAAFLFAGAYCIRRFRKAKIHSAHSVQRQITVTVTTVFITFMLRGLYASIIGNT